MVYLTCMSATGVATLVALRLVQRRNPLTLFRLPWRVALAGFIGVAVYTVLLATAFGMARDQDLGQVSLLNYLWPVWMVLLAMVLLPDRPRVLPTLIGAALGFLGVAVARGGGLFTDRPPSLLIAWFFRGSLSIGLLPGAGLIALGAWIAGRAAVKP